jgi:hypothetical protein
VSVDVRNGSGDAGAVTALVSRLATAGIRVGAVTTTADTTSAVQYPDGHGPEAGVLAAALGMEGSEQPALVDEVTVVIGAADAGRLAGGPLC